MRRQLLKLLFLRYVSFFFVDHPLKMELIVGAIALLVFLNLSFVASENCQINGTTWIKNNGFCYLFVTKSNSRMSYYDAEDYCRAFGAHLASVHSESENEFILNTMEERRTGGRMWIGFNLLDGENSSKWSDDTAVDYEKRVKKDYPKKEKCFMMQFSERGWKPEHCAMHHTPICKIQEGVIPTAIPPPTTVIASTGYCPSGWIQLGQKCYKYFGASEQDRLKYVEARDACWNIGKGHDLVSIHSMEEQAFLTQHLSDLGTSAWIGINKVESNEIGHDIVFGWVDNSRNDFSYWATGHPPPGTWKYCGRLSYDEINKGEWLADYCEINRRGYICQRLSDPELPKPTPKPSKCQKGFQEYRNSCYRYMNEQQTQDKAEENCRDFGGHLLSIVDGFEQVFLYNFLKNESRFIGIGLESVQGTHYLRWTDKQPFYYSNWADGQPQYNPQNKSCAYVDFYNDFKWNMTDCSRQNNYVCKIATDAPPKVPVVLGSCPTGESAWIDVGDNYCYHVPTSNRVMSWDTTSRYCLSKGMKMISLHSDHVTKSLMAYLWRESRQVHLGLIRIFDKKSFMWIDGTTLNYTNWQDHEPSSWFSDRNCVAFSLTDGKWSPINCNDGGVVLCRIEKLN